MAVKFSNNVKTELSAGITNSATSIAVVDASGFPSLSGSDYTLATIVDLDDIDVLEVVKVTAISSNTLTVVRAQESTTARAFASGDRVELRFTSGLLQTALDDTTSSSLDDATALAIALG